jgi:hypothetical protein
MALSAGVLALSLAACGGGGGEDADPAAAVPASAPIYVQATLRPEGDLQENTNAALKKILRTNDPAATIEKAIASSDPNTKVDYQQDVEPWLGSRAGAFVTSISGTNADGAAVIASKDNDKAQEFLDSQVDSKAAKKTYKDVDYRFADNSATGIVGDYVVVGSERGFRTVVDTVNGDGVETIDGNDSYKKALDTVGSDDALGTVFVSTQGLIDALARSGGVPPDTVASLRQAITASGGTATAVKLGVSANAIAIDSATLGVKKSASGAQAGNAAAALSALPGDAWMGIGLGAIGPRLRQALQQVAQVGSLGGTDVNGQLGAMQQALGIDLDKDLFSWMGDGGLFVRGTTIADIGGALVVESSDPNATAQALGKIRRLVGQLSPTTKVTQLRGVQGADAGLSVTPEGFPFPVILALAGDKFVAGINPQAVEAAIAPSSKLADSASFKQAASALAGVDPTFFVDVAPILQLADGLGAGDDPDFAKVRSYLAQFTSAAAGSKREGDTQRAKLVVTLKG